MDSHFTWQGPSRSDFAVCGAGCCEKHGKSFHLAEVTLLSVRQDVVKSMEIISLGRGQAEVTLLSVKQDVVNSMEAISLGRGQAEVTLLSV